MSSGSYRFPFFAALLLAVSASSLAWGQHNDQFFNNRAVGGVSISPEGVLTIASEADRRLLRDSVLADASKPAAELNQPVELRMISLRGLEAALEEARTSGVDKLPDDIKYLAGIQRLQYVLVYPEKNDIVLAGPGEGWKVDENGTVIGITTGLPVLRLDDLLVAFRTVEEARKGGLTCSIDPTEQGLQNYQNVVKQHGGRMQPGLIPALEKAMGQQKISVTGVPESSRFARVLVASDYRMKRYAMELDKSPVKGMPSFVSMLKSNKGGLSNALPRWWMACNYEPLAKSEDGLAWELRGPGVKVMTEDDFVEGGKVKRSGKSSPVAQKWADMLTAKYAELAVKDPIFGELRNVMDACVIAALIEREGLLAKIDLKLHNVTSEKEGTKIQAFNVPKEVSSQCSVTKSGRDFIITASGGVEINSWSVIENVESDAAVGQVRDKAANKDAKAWWWN